MRNPATKDFSQPCIIYYLWVNQITGNMTTMRKIALGGIAVVIVATIALKIAGIYPGIVAVHALPFCIMLLIDITNKRSSTIRDEQER